MTQVPDTQPFDQQPRNLNTDDPRYIGGSAISKSVEHQQRSRWNKILRWLSAATLFVIVAGMLLSVSLLAAIYWQARTTQMVAVDAIVVLGAAQYNGNPSPVLRARLDEALVAYNDGLAPFIIVSGGRQPGDQFTEAEASRNYLVRQGVPESVILLENEGRSSEESMDGIAEILRSRGLQRMLLVSDGFHLFRLKIMARHLGFKAFGLPASDSPITQGSGQEWSYMIREAGAIMVYLWQIRPFR